MFHFVRIPRRNFLSAPGRSGNSVFAMDEPRFRDKRPFLIVEERSVGKQEHVPNLNNLSFSTLPAPPIK